MNFLLLRTPACAGQNTPELVQRIGQLTSELGHGRELFCQLLKQFEGSPAGWFRLRPFAEMILNLGHSPLSSRRFQADTRIGAGLLGKFFVKPQRLL
jgi:hypothetical protein